MSDEACLRPVLIGSRPGMATFSTASWPSAVMAFTIRDPVPPGRICSIDKREFDANGGVRYAQVIPTRRDREIRSAPGTAKPSAPPMAKKTSTTNPTRGRGATVASPAPLLSPMQRADEQLTTRRGVVKLAGSAAVGLPIATFSSHASAQSTSVRPRAGLDWWTI